MISNVLFVIPPKTHPLDITGPAQLFYECIEYGAKLKLHYVSSSEQAEVTSSIGLSYSKLSQYDEFSLSTNDLIFIPGISAQLLTDQQFIQKQQPFYAWLRTQYHNGATICSICTGAFLLAESGLLHHKKATTHWKFIDLFRSRYPAISFQKNSLFVENERLFTSAGMTSGVDLCLYLIEREYGAKFAIDIAKEVVIYFRRGEADPQLSIFLQYRNHLETRIHDAQDYMAEHLNTPLKIEVLAKQVNMSTRNFTRLFKKTTGITVGHFLTKLRIERAVQLLAQGEKLNFIASQCGLKSANQIRSLLKKHENKLPAELSKIN